MAEGSKHIRWETLKDRLYPPGSPERAEVDRRVEEILQAMKGQE